MLSVRTLADLDLLEAQIAEEDKNLLLLKESLEKAEDLTKRMIKTLDDFDDRIAELDPIIIPIFRTVQGMSLVNTNVENTLSLVHLIEGYNNLADSEADLMNRNLSIESVADFMASVNRISNAIDELKLKGLEFCTCTSDRLNGLVQQGINKLMVSFKDWLEQCSQPIDPNILDQLDHYHLPEANIEALKLISGFALASDSGSKIYSDISSIYIQIRSEFLQKTIEPSFTELQEFIDSSEQSSDSGEHRYLKVLNRVIKLLEEEELFALQVMPNADISRITVARIIDQWLTLTQNLTSRAAKSLDKGQFSDQVILLELVQDFTIRYNQDRAKLAPLRDSLKALTNAAAVLLTKLKQEMESEAKQGSAIPTPTNSTVFEQTSSLLNVLRRISEHQAVTQSLLSRIESGSQETLLIQSDITKTPNLAAYCQQNLVWLEKAIDLRAKNYKKALAALIFRINNYRYIQKALGSNLGGLISENLQQHYQSVVEQLKDQYILAWSQIAGILGPVEGFGPSRLANPSMAPKDRAKVFMAELDEAIKLQSTFAMPDAEFRFILKEQINKIVLDVFDQFYAQNQTVFITLAARTGQPYDRDTVNELLSKILSG